MSYAEIKTTGDDLIFKVNGQEIVRIKPSGQMEVSGTVTFDGGSSLTCNSSYEGVMRYDADTNYVFVCNGTRWRQLSL